MPYTGIQNSYYLHSRHQLELMATYLNNPFFMSRLGSIYKTTLAYMLYLQRSKLQAGICRFMGFRLQRSYLPVSIYHQILSSTHTPSLKPTHLNSPNHQWAEDDNQYEVQGSCWPHCVHHAAIADSDTLYHYQINYWRYVEAMTCRQWHQSYIVLFHNSIFYLRPGPDSNQTAEWSSRILIPIPWYTRNRIRCLRYYTIFLVCSY